MKRLLRALSLLGLLVTVGTCGYIWIEGWHPRDGFYMTVITLSTVGYGETNDLSEAGRSFTSLLIFFCLIGMTYWSAALTSLIVERELSGQSARRRMLKMISKLKDHVIVCGTEPMAHTLIEKLIRKRIPVVLIDEDPAEIEQFKKRFRRLHVVVGNPTNEMTLAEANILNAKTVVAALHQEVDNLLIGITCKDIGKDIMVLAKSNDPILGNRMRKSGIDHVISPAQLCGDHMAGMIAT
jgi:voltage-gated potassium channel